MNAAISSLARGILMTAMPQSNSPVEVFYSYSRKDEKLRMRLEAHLEILRRQGYINAWHDRQITAGDDWAREVDTHLNSAQLILLLVSPDFIASDYCYDVEMKKALERHETGEAKVVPIILRPCKWKGTPFGKLQALPKSGRPVTRWANQDEAFLDIAEGIQKVVEELKAGHSLSTEAAVDLPSAYSDAPQSADRGQWVLVLSGTINENERPLVKALEAHLRKLSKDVTLTLLRVERGSIVLVLEGSRRGFDLLSELIESGQISEILEHQVEGIHWGSYSEWAKTRLRSMSSSAAEDTYLRRRLTAREIAAERAYKQFFIESPSPGLTHLIEREYGRLLNMAESVLRRTGCVDPADHCQDVMHQAVLKFLRAARRQGSDYSNVVQKLRAAVQLEAVRHGKTCRAEQAKALIDQGALSEAWIGREALSDPMETMSALHDLQEGLSGVNDRDLFFQYFVEGKTVEEIAKVRGQTTMKVKREVKKIMKELGVKEED
jgi:DNA-directed RNA polymerase specialized sigma24 family protein